MPISGTISQQDASRIGKGIVAIEQLTKGQRQGLPISNNVTVAFAKITKNLTDGLYEAVEVLINEDVTLWIERTKGRKWGEAEDKLEPIFDIDFDESLTNGTIVLVLRTNIQGIAKSKGKWAIITGGVSSSVGGGATDKSNTAIKGKVQFRNDITFNKDASDAINKTKLGSVSLGNVIYGGQEEDGNSGSDADGKQRHYKWMFNEQILQSDSYLIPNTDASIEQDEESINLLNQLWIQFQHRFSGQVMEIFHGTIGESDFSGNDELKHEYVNDDTVRGRVYVYGDMAGTNLIALDVDRAGHALCIDGTYTIITPPPITVNIEQVVGAYPT